MTAAELRFCRWCFSRLSRNNVSGTCFYHRWKTAPQNKKCSFCGQLLQRHNSSGFCVKHRYKSANDKATAHAFLVARRNFVDSVKLERGCADCGYNEYACALDFDHLPGVSKEFDISRALTTSLPRLLAEIQKCEVVCANCHRIRTKVRGQHV